MTMLIHYIFPSRWLAMGPRVFVVQVVLMLSTLGLARTRDHAQKFYHS